MQEDVRTCYTTYKHISDFVRESNFIEGIIRDPTADEINELKRFMDLPVVTVNELIAFVKVYQPNARLRDAYGLDVRVGNYYPPFGSPEIRQSLTDLLSMSIDCHKMHILYEKLHPFTDCNGRSGRALWARAMQDLNGGFLKNFYYQTLQKAE